MNRANCFWLRFACHSVLIVHIIGTLICSVVAIRMHYINSDTLPFAAYIFFVGWFSLMVTMIVCFGGLCLADIHHHARTQKRQAPAAAPASRSKPTAQPQWLQDEQ